MHDWRRRQRELRSCEHDPTLAGFTKNPFPPPFYPFASAVGGMQNSYFFMGLRSLKKIGDLTILLIYYRPLSQLFGSDDGHFYHNGIFLNTQSYSEDGVKLLIEALKLKFNIDARPTKVSNNSQQFRIFIPAKDRRNLRFGAPNFSWAFGPQKNWCQLAFVRGCVEVYSSL